MKTLFIFNIQSISDVITNSSSELFIFNSDNTESDVIDILNSIYPDWEKEYYLDNSDSALYTALYEYFYICAYYGRYVSIEEYKNTIYNKIKSYIDLPPEKMFSNWDTLKEYDYSDYQDLKLSDIAVDEFREQYPNFICLWSFNDNPNWDYQEVLMEVAERYHLG